MDRVPRPPVIINCLLDDPDLVRRLVAARAPYWPVQRYFANSAEYATLSGSREPSAMVVAPVFRGNWALGGQVLDADVHRDEAHDGVDEILHHPSFVEGARDLFGAQIVRPDTVYVNLTWQLPFAQGAGHTDIPAFIGFDRTEHPIAFLTIMGLSGLFEEERVKVATGVAWFYAGTDGGFEYWPEGPSSVPVVHEGAITNTAVVGDNDFMWHRVRPTGKVEDGMVTLALDSELRHGPEAGRWSIVGADDDPQRLVAEFPSEKLRISLSWKGMAFTDTDDERRYDERRGGLDLATVIGRFTADLRARGISFDVPADPERDPDFIRVLHDAYVHYPSRSAAA